MNDKKFTQKNKKKSFIQENGFLIGLYAIVGVLVVAAIGVTFSGSGSKSESDNSLVAIESKAVGNSLDESYTSKNDFSQIGTAETETPREETIPNEEPSPVPNKEESNSQGNIPEEMPPETPKEEPVPNSEEMNKVPEEPETTPDVKINDDQTSSETKVNEEVIINVNSDITTSDIIYEDDVTSVISQPILTYSIDTVVENPIAEDTTVALKPEPFFSDESLMLWPTNGEILMKFSMDKVVYDKTLDQFRTNDSVYIGAKVGDKVVAAADGTVAATGKNIENGTYIIINHGNGWRTIYSQLNESIKVSKGEYVTEGQLIGHVATPTNYGVNQGSHLNFKVEKNQVPVNPLVMLRD